MNLSTGKTCNGCQQKIKKPDEQCPISQGSTSGFISVFLCRKEREGRSRQAAV